jgi:hypothetical protein
MPHNYNEPTHPTDQTYQRDREQEHAAKVPRSCLGTGCCPWCGWAWERCECEEDDEQARR